MPLPGAFVPTSLSNNQRGVLAIVGCMTSYTVNDVLVKQILRTYPVGEVIFVRGIIAALLIGAVALGLGHRKEIVAAVSPLLTVRSAFDGLSTATFITALAHMPLANVAAVLAAKAPGTARIQQDDGLGGRELGQQTAEVLMGQAALAQRGAGGVDRIPWDEVILVVKARAVAGKVEHKHVLRGDPAG